MLLRTETSNGGTPLYGVSGNGLQMLISGSPSDDQWALATNKPSHTQFSTADVVTDEFQIHTLVFNDDSGQHHTQHYIDGQLVGTGDAGTASLAGLLLGAFRNDTCGDWSGDIAEVLVYSAVLSDLDRQAVEDYLYQKYFVPEPSAIVLLLLGVAFVWFRRRK